jgi:hypothetical protein
LGLLANSCIVKHVRDVSEEATLATLPPEATESTDAEPAAVTQQIEVDPTIANAGLTEQNDAELQNNGETKPVETIAVPEVATIDAGAANAVAEANWDNKLSQSVTSGTDGFEIVEHPRDPKETETGLDATPATATNTQSWAEDVPTVENPTPTAPTSNDDGFHQVSHNRGGRGRGGQHGEWRGRGRGRGDGYRGRGFRGDGRGRGRGGPRGGRGGGRGDSAQ